MVNRVFFLCVVLACGLSKTDARLAIDITENSEDPGNYKLVISCTDPDIDPSAKTVDFIQILKEDSNKKETMVAYLSRDNTTNLGNTLQNEYVVIGLIGGSNSVLNVTLKNPNIKDEGQYVCDIYYTDASGNQQHISSAATLKLPKLISQKDTSVSDDLKKLKDQINDLASKLAAQEKTCNEKIEKKAKDQELLVQRVVKNYNNQLNTIVKTINNWETNMNKTMGNVKDSLGRDVDTVLIKLNETIAELKNGHEEGQGQLETRMKDDLAEHVQVFKNVTKDLVRKDDVSELENRVSGLETVFGNLAEKISLVSDEVNVLEFLIQPQTPVGPSKADMAQFATNAKALEDRSVIQTQEISDLKKDLAEIETDVTAFSATFGNPLVAVMNVVVVFDKVIFNKGQGYNSTTGVFTAPRSGVYAFNLVLLTKTKKEWIDTDLMVDNNILIRLQSMASTTEHQEAVSAITPLQAGQEVKAIITYTAPNGVNEISNDNSSSIFSGYFLQSL